MLDNFNTFIFVITIINVLVDFFVNNTILYHVCIIWSSQLFIAYTQCTTVSKSK